MSVYNECITILVFLGIFFWEIYDWNVKITYQWRKPLILIGSILIIVYAVYFSIYEICFKSKSIDTTIRNLLIISIILGLSAIIFTIIKKNYQGRNQWRFPLTFVLSAIVVISGFLILITVAKNLKIAFVSVISIGILFILIGLCELLCKSQIKWLLIASLCVGVITIVSGIIGIMW